MVHITLENSRAVFQVQGLHKVLAFKSRFDIPLGHVADVRRAEPALFLPWWKGLRLPGTHLPGVVVAGTFYKNGERVFWDVSDVQRAIVVELTDERYQRLIVEVADPAAEVARFQAAPLT